MDTLTVYPPLANHWQICLPLSNALSFSWLFEMYELVTMRLQLCEYLYTKVNYKVYFLLTVGPIELSQYKHKRKKNTL